MATLYLTRGYAGSQTFPGATGFSMSPANFVPASLSGEVLTLGPGTLGASGTITVAGAVHGVVDIGVVETVPAGGSLYGGSGGGS